MKLSEKSFAKTLVSQLDGASDATIKKVAVELVALLASRRELGRLRGIIEAIEGAWADAYGASTISVESAYPLTEALRGKLAELAPGCELRQRVDASLIGGARVRMDDQLVDGTIDGHLKRLQSVFGNLLLFLTLITSSTFFS